MNIYSDLPPPESGRFFAIKPCESNGDEWPEAEEKETGGKPVKEAKTTGMLEDTSHLLEQGQKISQPSFDFYLKVYSKFGKLSGFN